MNVFLYTAVMLGLPQAVTTYASLTSFTKIQPTTCGPVRLSSGWVDRSTSSCAANCMTIYPQECHSFMFNNSTNLCTPAKGLSSSDPLPTLSEGDLYYHDYPEFNMFATGSSTVKVAYFTVPLTYTDARSTCKCLGAHLYAPDSWDKILLIGNVAIPRYIMWIGLDDIAVEGTFMWAKNGQEIDPSYKTAVFKSGQPDNGNGGQNCVFIPRDSYRLDDGNCYTQKTFICEMK